MATNYTSSALIEAQAPGARIFLTFMFWLWGGIGLLANAISFFGLTGSVGVGTSTYLAAGSLLWIGGMVLFGIGALIAPSNYDFKRPDPPA
jgi:hypothetical protein